MGVIDYHTFKGDWWAFPHHSRADVSAVVQLRPGLHRPGIHEGVHRQLFGKVLEVRVLRQRLAITPRSSASDGDHFSAADLGGSQAIVATRDGASVSLRSS